ncbi:hypothetical protein [Mycolicibacterium iranicum]|uniref:Uncharacterized protein n=1 Tax=Mycolicibacterium iranicum TaxID=912594 RepID=A0A178LU64_MYCIR|nr:hypothetical protein [Mycolicibacterium iranicum]OAN36802.1 hypothetical protein A4X20_06310 [Mycolicibacterium iranicum]
MTVVKRLLELSGRHEWVAALGVIAALCGALATVPVQTPLRAVLLLGFLLVGPGAAVMCWIYMPASATIAAVVGISIASVAALSVTMAWLRFWHPVPLTLTLSAAVAAGCLIRLRGLHNTASTGDPTW